LHPDNLLTLKLVIDSESDPLEVKTLYVFPEGVLSVISDAVGQ